MGRDVERYGDGGPRDDWSHPGGRGSDRCVRSPVVRALVAGGAPVDRGFRVREAGRPVVAAGAASRLEAERAMVSSGESHQKAFFLSFAEALEVADAKERCCDQDLITSTTEIEMTDE